MVNFIQQEIENDLKAGKYTDGIDETRREKTL